MARPSGIVMHLRGETMGTSWSVKLVAAPRAGDELRQEIEAILAMVVRQMSPWERDSDLSRFNRADAGSWHRLPAEFFHTLDFALALAGESGGAYDPTIGSLIALWGFGPAGARGIPDARAVAEAKARCGWGRVALDRGTRRARQPGGTVIDLNSIAKGFAVDCIAGHLKSRGCDDFLVEIGGELRGEGLKPDGTPWWVALEAPRSEDLAGRWQDTLVALCGLAAATTGDYRRYFMHGSRRYAHSIDPRTGFPAANNVASVTVLHADCLGADALSTTLTVLGEEEGMAFASTRGIAALFAVQQDGRLSQRMTPAFAAMGE